MWSWRDGERTQDNNNSGSTMFLRLLETTIGRIIVLISKIMATATILEQPQESTQDGGRCLEPRVNSW